MAKKKISEKDLFILRHSPWDICYPEVVDCSIRELPKGGIESIDLKKGTWVPTGHKKCANCKGKRKFGQTLLKCKQKRGDLIGVFNRNDTPQIGSIIYIALKAMRDKPI